MKKNSRRLFLTACLSTSCLTFIPAIATAEDKMNTVDPVIEAKTTISAPVNQTNQAPLTPAPPLETIEVDPQRPVIPIISEKPLKIDNMSLDEAKEVLQSLMDAQQKMMSQMQVLHARIQKTEVQAAETQEKLKASQAETNGALTSFARRTTITGYGEMGWRLFSNAPRTGEYLGADGDGNLFDMRRINLRTNVQFTEKASWYAEMEFEDAGNDFVGLEESAFVYSHKPWLNVKSGLLIPMLTVTNVNHDGPSRLLVDRPLVDQFVIPTTYRDLGIGIYGTVPVAKQSAISYDVMVLNGFTDLISAGQAAGEPVSTSVRFNGLRNMRPHRTDNNDHFRDNNENKAVYGRVGYMPFPGLNIGIASHIGKFDIQNEKTLAIYSGDIQYHYKKFGLLAEYAKAGFDRGNGQNSQGISFSQFPKSLDGYYVEGSYDITPKIKGILAWNQVDLDDQHNGDSLYRGSLGLRYNPFKRVYLKGEYQITSGRDNFSEEKFSNAFLMQLTFAF